MTPPYAAICNDETIGFGKSFGAVHDFATNYAIQHRQPVRVEPIEECELDRLKEKAKLRTKK